MADNKKRKYSKTTEIIINCCKPSSELQVYAAFIDARYGNDTTGALYEEDRPFQSLAAAYNAVIAGWTPSTSSSHNSASSNPVIFVRPGEYQNSINLAPTNVLSSLTWHFEPQTIVYQNTNPMFDLTAILYTKLWITGWGQFNLNNVSLIQVAQGNNPAEIYIQAHSLNGTTNFGYAIQGTSLPETINIDIKDINLGDNSSLISLIDTDNSNANPITITTKFENISIGAGVSNINLTQNSESKFSLEAIRCLKNTIDSSYMFSQAPNNIGISNYQIELIENNIDNSLFHAHTGHVFLINTSPHGRPPSLPPHIAKTSIKVSQIIVQNLSPFPLGLGGVLSAILFLGYGETTFDIKQIDSINVMIITGMTIQDFTPSANIISGKIEIINYNCNRTRGNIIDFSSHTYTGSLNLFIQEIIDNNIITDSTAKNTIISSSSPLNSVIKVNKILKTIVEGTASIIYLSNDLTGFRNEIEVNYITTNCNVFTTDPSFLGSYIFVFGSIIFNQSIDVSDTKIIYLAEGSDYALIPTNIKTITGDEVTVYNTSQIDTLYIDESAEIVLTFTINTVAYSPGNNGSLSSFISHHGMGDYYFSFNTIRSLSMLTVYGPDFGLNYNKQNAYSNMDHCNITFNGKLLNCGVNCILINPGSAFNGDITLTSGINRIRALDRAIYKTGSYTTGNINMDIHMVYAESIYNYCIEIDGYNNGMGDLYGSYTFGGYYKTSASVNVIFFNFGGSLNPSFTFRLASACTLINPFTFPAVNYSINANHAIISVPFVNPYIQYQCIVCTTNVTNNILAIGPAIIADPSFT